MKAVVSVIGKDRVGILAMVSRILAEAGVNIIDVTQSVLQDYFVMIMLVDISEMKGELSKLRGELEKNSMGMKINVMHEDIFNSMHRI
ncbi:MAG TPA: ACT domain-containing protein [Clostridiales bacterium]|jgi:ACT domain-containing protein|nr:ACT domain-containing protein [Clostridiales bacterium]